MKNQAIIFSKNRPCQLHLLLESLKVNSFNYFDSIVVLYKTEKDYILGYKQVQEHFKEVHFFEEQQFKRDLLSLLDSTTHEVTTLMVDDAVLYNPIAEDKQDILSDVINKSHIFSLRLGKNCTYSHATDSYYTLGDHKETEKYITFDYTKQKVEFAYPLSTDGHSYNTKLLKTLIELTSFQNPNTMEANLQYFVATRQIPQIVKCFKHSKLVTIPINLVNTVFNNRHGINYYLSIEDLNSKYLDGFCIDLLNLDFTDVNGPHKEIKFEFKPL